VVQIAQRFEHFLAVYLPGADGKHPGYGFERSCGYGAPEHRCTLAELGPCRVHRLSYAGVVA
jgi:ribonuclease HII